MSIIPIDYRPRTIRGITIAMVNDFKNIKVINSAKGSGGNTVQEIKVDMIFGHLNKFHQIITKDLKSTKQTYNTLPVMSLSWDSITFDGSRSRGLTSTRSFYDDAYKLSDLSEFFSSLNPKPWNLGFTLDIRTESMNHFTQILENVLPHYDPTRFLRVKEFSFLNIERDIKVKLEGVSQNFQQEVGEDGVSYIRGQLQFTVEAFLMVPEITNSKVIKSIHTRYLTNGGGLDYTLSDTTTSGWDSSASFQGTYDLSGNTSAFSNSNDFNFDFYFKNFD